MSDRAETPTISVLERETAYYEQERTNLTAQYPGRFLLIHGEELIGDFETMEEATAEGSRRFGGKPILVRLAGEDAPIASLTTIF